nr:unknown protein [uncultured bacterium]
MGISSGIEYNTIDSSIVELVESIQECPFVVRLEVSKAEGRVIVLAQEL